MRYQDADVRLNSDSVAILQSSHVQLIRGGIYIDEGRSPHRGPAVIVGTQFGTLTHVGTQFLVSVTDDDMRLAVREGAVAYSSNAETLTISAQDGATELIVSHTGLVTRRVPATGDLWSWTVEAAPGFVVNARSADAFLTWATRQTGAQLRYADDAARFHSETIVIHGDVRPLSVTRGFEILKATTGLNVDTSDPLIVFVSVPRAPSPGGRQSVD